MLEGFGHFGPKGNVEAVIAQCFYLLGKMRLDLLSHGFLLEH